MRATDGNSSVALTSNSAAFLLDGGVYSILAHSNAGSALTAALQILAADGVTFVTCSSTFVHVNGFTTVSLPIGTYRWSVTGAPGGGESFDLSVWRVPGD